MKRYMEDLLRWPSRDPCAKDFDSFDASPFYKFYPASLPSFSFFFVTKNEIPLDYFLLFKYGYGKENQSLQLKGKECKCFVCFVLFTFFFFCFLFY